METPVQRISQARADILKAPRTLVTVRKLRRPTVQVNIAEQQMNVVQS